ncbi:MAG TPA: Uma2 family endonuclease [Chloroflexia bacterium]|nr:Uma2 family endonuclease [Chloroflexia bacterium]
MLQPAKNYYTPQEYLRLEQRADYKSEYLDGEIYALAGGSPAHNQIAVNLTIDLGLAFRGKPCRVLNSDTKIAVDVKRYYTYPDLSVVCGPLEFVPEHNDTITNPLIIIEVLSPSTRNYDRGLKFERYRSIPTLQAYLVVDSERVFIEYYRKVEHDNWLLETLTTIEAVLRLEAIAVEVPLNSIYDKVDFSISD